MNTIIKKLEEYEAIYSIVARAHHIASRKYDRLHAYRGIPIVTLTAITGTAIFATIEQDPAIKWRITAGLLTLLVTVLSALQTTLRYNERAERHKSAGTKYSAIRRRFDLMVLKCQGQDESETDALEELASLLEEVKATSSETPNIPEAYYRLAEQEYRKYTNSEAPHHGFQIKQNNRRSYEISPRK